MRKIKAKPVECEHLNVGRQNMSGEEVLVCTDCMKTIDDHEFEKHDPAVDMKQFMKPGSTVVKVVEYDVKAVVKLPNLDEAFMPVFGAREGDVVVLYRPNPK